MNSFVLSLSNIVSSLLQKNSDVDATDSQSAIVSSPNVTMRITDRNGNNIQSAQVGDALMIRFEILETSSEYSSVLQFVFCFILIFLISL